ncbi:hypothetical protein [Fluviispira multicolorata]|uniref:Uncharacterized protein n=1 Tax=Fluviispira multicolorata TaxID=2654512 RepID=A0A833N550_9BACT|nr:hypothetical protein [Fluviispira multicolorata]KAB8029822.1 hypothetical protein GCL57_09795 [Fluviispira multicolorata]
MKKKLLRHFYFKSIFLINMHIIILSIVIFSCAPVKKYLTSTNTFETEDNWSDPNPSLTNEVNVFLQSKMNPFQACTQENAKIDSNCAPIKITAGAAEPKKSSLGYRIMIIDDYGMKAAAYTRYRNRVLKNIFENEHTGEFNGSHLTLEMPKAAKEILLDTFANASYEKMPSELLKPNMDLFYDKFNEMYNKGIFIGHSSNIFNYLANNSPLSQFVLVYANDNKFNKTLCNNQLSEDEKLIDIKNLYKNQIKEIINEIKQFKINFISFSRGYTNEKIRNIIRDNKCESISNKFISNINRLFFEYYLKPLTVGSNALLVQANAHSNYNITSMVDENFYSDCQELKSRVRIGTANDVSLSISSEGSHNLRILESPERNAKKCTDIYINFAVEKERPNRYRKGVIHFSDFNIGTSPPAKFEIASSFATPVAVSYLIHLKMLLQKENPGLEISNEMLLKRLNNQKNFIFDPSLHKQLPIYELKYLK